VAKNRRKEKEKEACLFFSEASLSRPGAGGGGLGLTEFLPEVFHQHEVIAGGVHSDIENRAAVWRSGERTGNLAESARYCRRASRVKVKELQASFTRKPIAVVDPFFEHCETLGDVAFQ
jgi:hypothetical protein